MSVDTFLAPRPWTEEEEAARHAAVKARQKESWRLTLRLGRVYFIEAVGSGRIKIGFTTGIPLRMSQLGVASPFPLKLLAAARAVPRTEPLLHLRFAALRVHGEWFRRGAELRAFIEAVRAAGPLPRICTNLTIKS